MSDPREHDSPPSAGLQGSGDPDDDLFAFGGGPPRTRRSTPPPLSDELERALTALDSDDMPAPLPRARAQAAGGAPAPPAEPLEAQPPRAVIPPSAKPAPIVAAPAPPAAPAPTPAAPVRELAAATQRMTPAFAWVLGGALALNLALVVVTLLSARSIRDDVLDATRELLAAKPVTPGEPQTLPAPAEAGTDSLKAALERARAEIDGGDCVRGRELVYGVLAKIDSLTAASRDDVEVQANLLLARSYERQARSTELAAAEGDS